MMIRTGLEYYWARLKLDWATAFDYEVNNCDILGYDSIKLLQRVKLAKCSKKVDLFIILGNVGKNRSRCKTRNCTKSPRIQTYRKFCAFKRILGWLDYYLLSMTFNKKLFWDTLNLFIRGLTQLSLA